MPHRSRFSESEVRQRGGHRLHNGQYNSDERFAMQRAVVSERTTAAARPWLAPAAFAAVLVAYNNLLFGLPGELAFPPDWVFFPRALLLALAAVMWAVRFQGLSPSDLGLTTRNLRSGAAIGLAAAVAITVPATLYFLFPVGVGRGPERLRQ